MLHLISASDRDDTWIILAETGKPGKIASFQYGDDVSAKQQAAIVAGTLGALGFPFEQSQVDLDGFLDSHGSPEKGYTFRREGHFDNEGELLAHMVENYPTFVEGLTKGAVPGAFIGESV